MHVSPHTPSTKTNNRLSFVNRTGCSGRLFQSGRSMIEMLAVLAIIGVLSVAAIAGLQWAFAKYRANNTIHDVHVWELAAVDSNQLLDMTTGELVLTELGNTSTHGYPMSIQVQDKDVFFITVDDVPKKVCRRMLDMIDDTMLVSVNDVKYDGTDLCDSDMNYFTFYFNKYMGDVGSICIPSCVGEERCCNNTCQMIQTPCGADGCMDCGSDYCTTSNTCCANPKATKCGDDDCCEGTCCNGVCCPDAQMRCINQVCQCQGDLVWDNNQNACVCPSEKPNYFEDDEGVGHCCARSYLWVPAADQCMRLTCPTGDGGICNLNGKLCCAGCQNTSDATQITASMGVCRADLCPKGTTFEATPKAYSGGYYWGCRADETMCYKMPSSHFYCFNESSVTPYECCHTFNADTCEEGFCDDSYCAKTFGAQNAQYTQTPAQVGGCLFTPQNVKCHPTNAQKTSWTCYTSTGNVCATNCTNPPDCNGACADPCTGNGQYIDGYCCVQFQGNTICQEATYYLLKTGSTYTNCGRRCTYSGLTKQADGSYTITGISCLNGSCSSSECSAGWTFEQVDELYYGCSKDNVSCAKDRTSAYTPGSCYINGATCGRKCADIQNENCQQWEMKQCAPSVTRDGITKPACIYGRIQGTVDKNDKDYDCWCQGDVDATTNICCPTGQIVQDNVCVLPL